MKDSLMIVFLVAILTNFPTMALAEAEGTKVKIFAPTLISPPVLVRTEKATAILPPLSDHFNINYPSRTGFLIFAAPPNEVMIFREGKLISYTNFSDVGTFKLPCDREARVSFPQLDMCHEFGAWGLRHYGLEHYTPVDPKRINSIVVDSVALTITYDNSKQLWTISRR